MSSAYSGATQYKPTTSTLDIAQLTTTVQQSLQGKYDANVAKVDSLISQYTSMPLLRGEDKQYLAERLQTIISNVDQNSKINWTSGSATRQVNSLIASAVDDKVLKQLSNSQAIINFEQTAAERKAKNPDLYNDDNYNYAKDKAGYEAYMKGETDDIGSLQYIDYYDVKKNLTDEVEKYAKERGFEKVLNVENNEYIFKTTKGKEVKPEEIESFVSSAINSNPRLQQQLLIDSHAKYRGAKEEDLLKEYSIYVDEKVKVYDDKITELENKKKNINKDDTEALAEIEKEKVAYSDIKNKLLVQKDPKNFNRDSVQYTQHVGLLMNKYVQAYAYRAETDIEYDDIMLKVMKAQGTLDENGTPTPSATGAIGQTYDRLEEPAKDEELPDHFKQIKTEASTAWEDAIKLIKNKLISEGKPATNKDITNYYAGIKNAAKDGFSVNANGYTDEEIEAYYKVTQNNIALSKITKIAKEQYSPATTQTLSGLFGGKNKDLNVEGLSQTMPYTAKLLQKYNNVNQLSKTEKALAMIEVANNAKNTIIDDEQEREQLDLYIDSLRRDNKISNAQMQSLKTSGEQPGFWSSYGKVLTGGAKVAGNVLLGGLTAVSAPFRRRESYEKVITETGDDITNAAKEYWRGVKGVFGSFGSDRNLGEVQSGDVSIGNYKSPADLFKNSASSAKEQIQRESEKYRANLPKKKSLVLSDEIKSDKPYVEQFKAAISANGGTPAKGGYINLIGVENGMATVRYLAITDAPTSKEGVTKKVNDETEIQIPVSNLPPSVLKRLQGDLPNYHYSLQNPTPFKASLPYSLPNNLDSKRDLESSYLNASASNLSPEAMALIERNGITEIKTKEDYLNVAKDLPTDYYEKFKKDVLASYKVDWERPTGGGVMMGTLKKNGVTVEDRIPLQRDFKPSEYKLFTIKVVNAHLEKQLEELKTAYRKTKY